jgi:hypothetical protein
MIERNVVLGVPCMTLFNDREKAEEARFARQSELAFRARARRNKLLAHWAAEKGGLSGEEVDQYAASFARAEFADADDAAIVARIRNDFVANGLWVPEAQILRRLKQFSSKATRDLAANEAKRR